ncbi:MAG: peptidylprolyl isomerase [Bacteroidota bacterium]
MKQTLINAASALLFGIFSLSAFSQNTDPVLIQVANEKISKNEFIKVFEKNNTKGEKPDAKSLEEYLDLYINFRLKVTEAKVLGMDTVKSFRDELSGYRKQLAQPFLSDSKANDKMIREAYDHRLFDLRASHILIRVDRLASAADTLAAWNKVMQLRNRIVKGEDFGKVAAEGSEDPSAKDRDADGQKVKGNHGDLGFFTAFDMVYAFETAAYNAKQGDVSMPVRTDFGYHLIKVTDKIPAIGNVQLAHIILVYPAKGSLDDSLKVADSANLAYKLLTSGNDFGDVAKKFSDDFSTSGKGGVLPWFGVNRLLPDFILNLNKMKHKGEYSEPFQTRYGWHIIKLVDSKPVGSFEEEKDDIKQRISRSDRNMEVQNSFVAKTKANYGYTQNMTALDELTKTVTDSIFEASWKLQQAAGLDKNLFTIGTKTYTQADFAKQLATSQRRGQKHDVAAYVYQQFNIFVNDAVNKYADSQLENENPDFKALIGEYHDGILLFDLTDKKVWSKAVKDTIGLQKFYDLNKNNYMWETRLDASILTITDPSIVKSLTKLLKKGVTDEQILAKYNHDSIQKVIIEHKKFIKGENMDLQGIAWTPGISNLIPLADNKNAIVVVHAVVAPEPKLLNEIRGVMTADYQNFLEKEWIGELRTKYPVVVNREVFSTILTQ